MHIRNVTLENVKSFRGQHRFDLIKGVNYFVGDNNSGKSTVMESLLFLFEGPTNTRWNPETFYSADTTEATRVEVDIADGVDELVRREKFQRLKDYVFEDQGERILRLDRSSSSRTVNQNAKSRQVDVKSVCFWHPQRKQFENVTGIDAIVKAIFDIEAVWADAHPSDHIDFATTKTLGRLIDSAFKRFTQTDQWLALVDAHERAFSSTEEESFVRETELIAAELKNLVEEQYGTASFRFDFGIPDAAAFMKQGKLHVDDGTMDTPVESKGIGMQRAIALGLIQLYARSVTRRQEENSNPLIFILDEPETWLHPTAQLRLGSALSAIGEHDQVFIITHSPYLIRKFDPDNHLLTVLRGHGPGKTINLSTEFGLFGVGEPTWGEINYRAFGINSNEFHNELYGHIQKHLTLTKSGDGFVSENEIDEFFAQNGALRTTIWVDDRIKGKSGEPKGRPRTLPVYIRNKIHHPENQRNPPFSDLELQTSTDQLVSIAEKINSTHKYQS